MLRSHQKVMVSCACVISLFIVLLTTKIAVAKKVNEDSLFFDAFPKHRITLPSESQLGTQQRTVYVSDKIECVFTCLGFIWCLSVNFNTTAQKDGLFRCGLMPVDRFSHPASLQEDAFFTHLSIKNPCEGQKPCLNGGTCMVHFDREEYSCACRQENSGEHCENVLYLNVSIQSVGIEDIKPNTTCVGSMIQVNNVENCLLDRGHNIIVYNKFGIFQIKRSFDTHFLNSSGQQMKTFLEDLPNESIVLIAVWDSASIYFWDAVPALQSIGATNASAVSEYRSSWLLMGYKGGSPSWITEKRAAASKGPSFANVKIPLPVNIP